MARQADVVVVGGGSAGAVMAARLSEEAKLRVVLIEAGQDTPPGNVPADIADTFPTSFFNRDYFWTNQTGAMREGEPQRPFPQPKVMGGGSSVMGMISLRGLPSDFQRWEAMGAKGWGWADVEPVYRALTNDLDRDRREQNTPGPYIVKRLARSVWPRFMHGIEAAAGERGLPPVPDVYATQGDGFFALPMAHDDTRATAARCYLDAAARARSNLAIVAEAQVERVLIEGAKVVGVRFRSGGKVETIQAGQVVVSAGAINSPALLQRSGIGDPAALRRAGVEPLIGRASVGRNYQNHPMLHFALTLEPASQLRPEQRHYVMTGIRASSKLEGCPAGDLFIFLIGRVAPKAFGVGMGMVAVALNQPMARGFVEIVSPEASVAPRVEQAHLSVEVDRQRMLIATRLAEDMIIAPQVRECYREAYLLPREAPLRLINGTGIVGAAKALGAGMVLTAPASIRKAVMARALAPGRLVADRATHVPLSDEEIWSATGTMFHPSGSCRMGAPENPEAVVDPECRVIGVEGLRVVDASVMPCLPSANTNLPTIMIAERAAEMMRRRLREEARRGALPLDPTKG
jgi:5-(hydroxymethyl)furfural/furfural oxidase